MERAGRSDNISGMNTPTSSNSAAQVNGFSSGDEFEQQHFGGGEFEGFGHPSEFGGEGQRMERAKAKVRMVKGLVEGMGVL